MKIRETTGIRASVLLLAWGIVASCGEGHRETPPADPDLADLELRLHGFKDPRDLERTVVALRAAAERGDKQALVNAIHYPFKTYDRGTAKKSYTTPEQVLVDYDLIFTSYVLDALRSACFGDLFVRDIGAMIGRGEVWVHQFDEGIRIHAINSSR